MEGAGASGPVEVTLLGDVAIGFMGGRSDRPAALGGRAAVVFARLALDTGRAVSRDALVEAVWGEVPPQSWPSALRNAVVGARRWIAATGVGEAVRITRVPGGGYRLDLPEGSTLDLDRLALEAAELEALLRSGASGEVLRGVERALAVAVKTAIPGAGGDWIDGLRAQTGELRSRIERVGAEAALALGESNLAERLAQSLVAASPLREDGHRLLMRAQRAAGNSAQALVSFDACRRLLSEELGALPAPATESLFLEILAERGGEAPEPPASTPVAPAAGSLLLLARERPFVGRERLLERLVARLAVARGAGPLLVRLAGEPGAGKTRLAAELAARVHAGGAGVLYGRAEDRVGVPPYQALVEALWGGLAAYGPRRAAEQLGAHAGVIAQLMPSLGLVEPAPRTGIDELDRVRIERAVLASLHLLAGSAGALLVLDDMHWASRLDLGLVDAIVSDRMPLAVLVVVLERPRTDQPERHDAWLGSPRSESLELEALSAEELSGLVQADGLASEPEELTELADELLELSGGNPLLARELVRAWREGRTHRGPARISTLVHDRLARLPPEAERVLQIAAVAGLEFDPDVVTAASEAGAADVTGALAAARDAGLLVGALGDSRQLAFRHALVRAALLDSLSSQARRQLHERLARALEPPRDQAALLTVAHHVAAAPLGEWRRALRYGLPASRAAAEAGVYEDVITIAGRTREALEAAQDPDPRARIELEVLLGGAQRALGEPAGHDTLRAAFTAAVELDEPSLAADAALAFCAAGAATEEAYLDDSLITLYEQALERLADEDQPRRARVLGRLASAYAWRQDAAAASRAGEQALALARELGDQATLADVLTTTRRGLTGSGALERQAGLESEQLALAEALDDPGQRVRASLWRFDTSIEQGYGEPLERLIATATEHVGALRMGNYHHSLAYSRGALALLRGHVEHADALVERAAATGLELGVEPTIVQAIKMIQLMGVRHEQGRLRELRDDAESFFTRAGVPEWLGALAFIDGELGRTEAIEHNLAPLLDSFTTRGPVLVIPIGFVAHMAAPIARLGDRPAAARLYDALTPFAGHGAYFAYFGGPFDYHLALLARTLGDARRATEHLTAAASFCQRLGAPRWSTRVLASQRDLAQSTEKP